MIEGLRIDVTADELSRLLESRIQYHRDEAAECVRKGIRAASTTSPDPADPEAQLVACWDGYRDDLERRAEHHQCQAAVLTFFREHLVSYEIYRLDLSDIQEIELDSAAVEEWSGEGDRP